MYKDAIKCTVYTIITQKEKNTSYKLKKKKLRRITGNFAA